MKLHVINVMAGIAAHILHHIPWRFCIDIKMEVVEELSPVAFFMSRLMERRSSCVSEAF